MMNRGWEWRRWEPHIHTPGTVLNNQFGAVDPWAAYLAALEQVTPKLVTDKVNLTEAACSCIASRAVKGSAV
jgi:hypothetical protein